MMQLRLLVTFPVYAHLPLGTVVEALGSFLYPLVLSLPLPVCVALVVAERDRSNNLRALLISMGLQPSTYLLSNFIFHLLISLALAAPRHIPVWAMTA